MGAAWEAFTACGKDEPGLPPDVRPLDNSSGRYDWPDDEVTNDIAGFEIHVHGDHPAGAFVRAWGRTPEAVTACVRRLVDHVVSGALSSLYGEVAMTPEQNAAYDPVDAGDRVVGLMDALEASVNAAKEARARHFPVGRAATDG